MAQSPTAGKTATHNLDPLETCRTCGREFPASRLIQGECLGCDHVRGEVDEDREGLADGTDEENSW
jgi:hypothetical protein